MLTAATSPDEGERIRILLIEDSENDAFLLGELLRESGLVVEIEHVRDAAALRSALSRRAFDVAISDWVLGDRFDGPAALRIVRESDPELPVILVSAILDEERAVEGLRAGASDFVPKGATARLIPAIEREAKRRRETLARAREVARLKTAFLSNVSHEVRLPLQILTGGAELLGEAVSEDDTLAPVVTSMRDASARLVETVTAFLDLARLDAGLFETCPILVDVPSLVEGIVRELAPRAASKGLSLSAEIAEGETLVAFDEYCLTQVIRKLLDNALKFTEEGCVTLRLARDTGGALSLEVRDTGVGMDESFLARLGEAFTQEDPGATRRFEGAGTGLALTGRFLALFGAHLSVESRKGEGSVFRIRFADQAATRATAVAAVNGERPLILAVEDDPPTRSYLDRALRLRYDLVFAQTGSEARARLSASGKLVRLVLMDLSLHGEDGPALGRLLRQDRKLPLLAVTERSSPTERRRALDAGCDAFVARPLSSRMLISTIERLLVGAA